MAAKHAALGFRLHTGWAALAAVAGRPGKLDVLLRRRLELMPADGAVSRFVYHSAAELEWGEAAEYVRLAEKGIQKATREAVQEALRGLQADGVVIQAAGIPTGSTAVPGDLAAVLRAHMLIHAAEGALFQRAVAAACETSELKVTSIRERDLWAKAAAAYGLAEDGLRDQIQVLRQTIGPPWGADQKTATVAALLALRGPARR